MQRAPTTNAAAVVGTRAAAFTSATLIAHQVAGKAARDALFLSSFSVSALPAVMAVGAVLSLVAALWMSRLLTRYSPAAVLPILFASSMCGLVIEWAIGHASPRATAVAVFLHIAVFGPLLISAFWSLINERFDPHSARHAIGRIALGGTIGGVLGALIAWRVATLVALPTLILLLAGMQGACLIGTYLLRAPTADRAVPTSPSAATSRELAVSAVTLLRREPYLRNVALLVALAASMSGVLDFLFSRQAAANHAKGAELLTFFSMFWLAVAVASLLIQVVLGQRALGKFGIAANIAILPAVVITGGAVGLAAPGYITTSALRGAEAVQRNTLYRSAYEMLYTPLSEAHKRSIKAQIDIGCDRLGTIAAAGLVMLFLAISEPSAATYLMAVAVGLGIVTLPIVRDLHTGYVSALEHGLRDGATKLALPSLAGEGTSTEQTAEDSEREALIQRVELLRPRHDPSAPAMGAVAGAGPAWKALLQPEAFLFDGRHLLTGDVDTVARELRALPLETTTPVTAFLILLLAHKHLHAEALEALRRAAPAATGQLIDALLDPAMDFVVRRRIPSALASCASQRAADGLLLGLADERFEVRYACGRALSKIADANPGVVISRQKIVQAILIEVDREAPGVAAPDFEADPTDIEEASGVVDDVLARDRVDRTLEHVFTVLGLHLEREPMRMAYRALRHPDVRHRGTALEYLQTILPKDIRDAVWPLVGALAPLPAARTAREILADLLRATVVQTKQGGERD